jgi:septum formation protein
MIDRQRPLLLGSSSPRRREILTTLGLPIRVAAADIDESRREGEAADAYLVRIAQGKLEAVVRLGEAEGAGAILVADTAVILDGEALGKPRDEADARSMIRALSGREHEVWTRFAIGGPREPSSAHARARARALHAETVSTRVRFRALGDDEIEGYAATGEGLDKAGAYAIQGIGAFMVERIDGSWSNVVGLPACEVIAALREAGLLARFPLPKELREGGTWR